MLAQEDAAEMFVRVPLQAPPQYQPPEPPALELVAPLPPPQDIPVVDNPPPDVPARPACAQQEASARMTGKRYRSDYEGDGKTFSKFSPFAPLLDVLVLDAEIPDLVSSSDEEEDLPALQEETSAHESDSMPDLEPSSDDDLQDRSPGNVFTAIPAFCAGNEGSSPPNQVQSSSREPSSLNSTFLESVRSNFTELVPGRPPPEHILPENSSSPESRTEMAHKDVFRLDYSSSSEFRCRKMLSGHTRNFCDRFEPVLAPVAETKFFRLREFFSDDQSMDDN
jgi:hypothetical protein